MWRSAKSPLFHVSGIDNQGFSRARRRIGRRAEKSQHSALPKYAAATGGDPWTGTTRDVANAIMEMDEAHSSHAYRYIPRPVEGESLTVYSAHPAVALTALQELLYQCATDTHEIRVRSNFPEEWPPASIPVHPITTHELKEWIEEKKRLRTWAEELKSGGVWG